MASITTVKITPMQSSVAASAARPESSQVWPKRNSPNHDGNAVKSPGVYLLGDESERQRRDEKDADDGVGVDARRSRNPTDRQGGRRAEEDRADVWRPAGRFSAGKNHRTQPGDSRAAKSRVADSFADKRPAAQNDRDRHQRRTPSPGGGGEERMEKGWGHVNKFEARKTKSETNLKEETRKIRNARLGLMSLLLSPLELVSDFGFRISDFPHSTPASPDHTRTSGKPAPPACAAADRDNAASRSDTRCDRKLS